MKISLNWLKDYIDIQSSPQELEQILTGIGLEVEGVSEVESIPGGLQGLIIGEVLTKEKHPNADRLSLATVDIGTGDPLQIVCGAPNVAAGQKVVVATVGTTLYPVDGDSFKIKKGKIRGAISEGMICAEDEIGIGDSHDGIIVLPEDTPVGQLAYEVYQVETDTVYEIGLTPNRSDATSHLGVAKDLLAYYRYHQNPNMKLRYPDVRIDIQADGAKQVPVEVRDTVGCPRFSGITLSEVRIGASPEWMQRRLSAIGVRPINNMVDVTNYVLHEYGQPLHAYDLAKISGQRILVQQLPEGSKFVTLDEKERRLSNEDLMVCDGDQNPMCIAGVFGGLHSGVTELTTDIYLEGAHWDPQMIRKTSTRHNLRTDAAKCFEKGSDPAITIRAIKRAASLMVTYGGAKVTSEFTDEYPEEISPVEISVRKAAISDLIGCELSESEIKKILDALDIHIASEDQDTLVVTIPTNKADVLREADVIEEILRIYGYNNVPISDRLNTSIMHADPLDKVEIRRKIGDLLSHRGYLEMMSLSLISSKHYKELPSYLDRLVYINNTSNIHLDVMRPEMMMSALINARHNINRQQRDLALYENGRSYQRSADSYQETEWITILMSGSIGSQDWTVAERPVAFVDIKRASLAILARLGIQSYQISAFQDDRFAYGLMIHRGEKMLAKMGAVSSTCLVTMDIDQEVMYAELSMDHIQDAARNTKIESTEIPRYPASRRDLALAMDEQVSYEQVEKVILKSAGSLLKEVTLFDVYRDKKSMGAHRKSYAVSLIFEDPDKTLKDKVIDKQIAKVIDQLQQQLSIELR